MHRLQEGISLSSPLPELSLWTDSSDTGWGAHLEDKRLSGQWSQEELTQHINWKELKAIHLALLQFQDQLSGLTVAILSDNTTALAYLKNQGGTISPTLNSLAQEILRWAEEKDIRLIPQFVMGERNIVADVLSRTNKVLGSEWTINQEVVDNILKIWPANVDLFATAMNFRLQNYFSPVPDPQAIATDAFLQDWSGLDAYAFPPLACIRKVLNHFIKCHNIRLVLIAPRWHRANGTRI